MKLHLRRTLATGFALLLVSLTACSGLRELSSQIADLNRLQKQLQQQTGQTGINVNLNNGSYLNISFINSSLAKLPSDQKKAKALEIARFAYSDWAKRAGLSSVTVIFQTSYDVGPVHYSNSMDNFAFQPSELATAAAPTSPH